MGSLPPVLPDVLAAITLLGAVAQAALVRRIDLGPAVLALGLGALQAAVAVGVASQAAGLSVVAAAIVSAWAQGRAARAGVGRPSLRAWVVAAAAGTSGVAAFVAPGLPLPTQGALDAAPLLTVLVGGITVLVARERRGLAGQRVFHYREVPIGGPGGTGKDRSDAPRPAVDPQATPPVPAEASG